MVFFTCNVCGEALKKNQVEKHCMTKCRRCEMVSCIDCGKDFWGNDYEQHTKCISEDQKYSGKGFVPKVNKGEAKQDRWIEQVQIAIDKNKNNPQLRGTLESIKNYPNIPRKKNKFENFLQNSLRIRDRGLMARLWGALMEEAAQHMKQRSEDDNSKTSNVQQSDKQNTNIQQSDTKETTVENGTSENGEEKEKKLSKRERKEERRKKMNKKEKKDKENGVVEEECSGKKRKLEETYEGKGKKRKREEESVPEEIEVEEGEEEEEEEEPVRKKTKFNWIETITEVLQAKGEITVKKLKKKVLAEYLSQMGELTSEEKLWAKFEKKLTKNPTFKVHKERVKLVQTS